MSDTSGGPSAGTPAPWDRWAAWVLNHRHAGDVAVRERMMAQVFEYRDRVLTGARIRPGDVVLDVGCGDGLLGVAAVDLVGPDGAVVFSDISVALLDQCRRITADVTPPDRCRFVHTGLPALAEIATASVDVVMTRSVLIYVSDKAGAFQALRRVLRDGGRLSIFEPINRFGQPEPDNVLWGCDVTGLEALAAKVKETYRGFLPEPNTLTDFDERDLLGHARAAGFTDVRLDYHAEIGPDSVAVDWSALLRQPPNPLVPAPAEVLERALPPAEREVLADRMRHQVETGTRRRRLATAYLTASV
jgi:arsenite methyltransferase